MTVASTSAVPESTAAGIVERADTQQRVIPESRRADGSIRKERKVRPGFTPVEDVARYRPARAREAEEARKRGVPGSAAALNAPSSSSSSSNASHLPNASNIGKSDTARTAWRSSTAKAPIPSIAPEITSRPRGNFAPLEPVPARRTAREPSSKTGLPDKIDAQSSAVPSWRNSRLCKPQSQSPNEERENTATVPDTWDQEKASFSKETDKKQSPERIHISADALAAELDSLRINSSRKASGYD